MINIKKIFLSLMILLVAFFSFTPSSEAVVSVRGYYRSNGTYVAPHYRSDPNSSVYDNWSYKGNVNPYTGKVGTNTYGLPYRSSSSYVYTPNGKKVHLSKREKKVVACQATGKTEAYCKSVYMKKK